MKKIIFRISIALNILLISGFIIKRLVFQYNLRHPGGLPTYDMNPQYDEQQKIYPAYKGTARVAMFGDSHMYKVHWDELMGRDDIANRGIGSDITAGMLHRVGEIQAIKPEVVFIEGGANDVYYHIPTDTILSNLGKIIDVLKTVRTSVILHTLPPMAKGNPITEEYNRDIIPVNAKIKKLAAQKEIDLIDLYALLQLHGYLNPVYAQGDQVHITAAAYLKWDSAIERHIPYVEY